MQADPSTTVIPSPSDPKFLTDINLGALARWLRILGYDTRFDRGEVNRDFLRRAQQEDRIVLTRKRETANRQFRGRLIVVLNDRVSLQLREVMEKLDFPVNMDGFYRRCSLCNALLVDLLPGDAEDRVPDFIYHQSGPFRRCPDCGKIYWSGTHREKALAFLRRHIPAHLP
jgi:uncharacterized protein